MRLSFSPFKAVLFVSLALLLLWACKHEVQTDPLAGIPNEMLLNIPTYDGSGQGVHPDVLLLDPPINGNHFMMAFTPYPYYNARLENPSILVSQNGVDFVEPVAGINPLVPAPAYDHNDDPDLLYDKAHQKYYFHYLQTMRPDSQNIILLQSGDGINWSASTSIHFSLTGGDPLIVSPAFVQLTDGKSYRTWYVSLTDPSGIYNVKSIYSPDGLTWDKTQVEQVNLNLPSPLVPWHLDVMKNGQQYIMLCCCRIQQLESQYEKLMIGVSTDGLNWQFNPKPLIATDSTFHNCESIYRSCGLISNNSLVVYYSMDDYNNEWHIGVKKFALDSVL
jgi:hypothetical protein